MNPTTSPPPQTQMQAQTQAQTSSLPWWLKGNTIPAVLAFCAGAGAVYFWRKRFP